jgi:hypothetical protein
MLICDRKSRLHLKSLDLSTGRFELTIVYICIEDSGLREMKWSYSKTVSYSKIRLTLYNVCVRVEEAANVRSSLSCNRN